MIEIREAFLEDAEIIVDLIREANKPVAKHSKLLNWYEKMNFIKGETKHFEHLPFSVTYVTYAINKD